jgi:uncharacterized tellurite resistance protein B-like protein
MLRNISNILSSVISSSNARSDNEELLASIMADDSIPENLAYTTLLLDLARADGNFDPREHAVISSAVQRLFHESPEKCALLIESAENMLDAFRGPGQFVTAVREQYSPEEREQLYTLIEGVVLADGTEDPVEQFFKKKLKNSLA